MKTIQYLLILGLLVPQFGFAYGASEDIVVMKNTTNIQEKIRNNESWLARTISFLLRWFVMGFDWLSYPSWIEFRKVSYFPSSEFTASALFIRERDFCEKYPFTIDCVRNT